MNILVLDTEATIYEKGNPFSKPNRLMCIGTLFNGTYTYHDIEHSGLPYDKSLDDLRQLLRKTDLLIGFNIKYDLHWLRHYLDLDHFPRIHDCQLAEFILKKQTNPYPSLDFSSQYYGLEPKHDTIALEYWGKGIDTTEVPVGILQDRVESDVKITYELYLQQLKVLTPQQLSLLNLQCEDLKVLADIEYNGMLYDVSKSISMASEAKRKIDKLCNDFNRLVGSNYININSPSHLSALIYGGYIAEQYKETYEKVLNSGTTVIKSRNAIRLHLQKPLVMPLKGSESVRTKDLSGGELAHINNARTALKKPLLQRIYSTDEPTLRSLKASGVAKEIIRILLEQSKLEKLRGTYYLGIPQLIDKMEWNGSILHGQFNQCVARTGRLSASKPNLTNFATDLKPLFPARNNLLINVDAKALEWVCACFLSQDPVGMQELINKVDLHEENRNRFKLPSRLIAKTFLFRLIYGGSAYSYAHDPDFADVSTSEKFWQNIIDETFNKYRGLRQWHIKTIQTAIANGKIVMPTGREYKFIKEKDKWPERQMINYPVQGLGADLLSIIRVSLAKRLKKYGCKSLMICTVHDSILLDALDNEKEIICNTIPLVFQDLNKNFKRVFNGVEFNLPLRCELSIGPDWGSMKEI